MGVATGGWFSGWQGIYGVEKTGSWISKGYGKLSRTRNIAAYFPLGLLLGLLPCAPVYTALIGTARAGMEAASPCLGMVSGAGLMSAFGLGTGLPMILVARLASMGWLQSRTWIYRIGSLMMIGVGVFFLLRDLRF